MINPKQQKRAPISATYRSKRVLETRKNGSRRSAIDFSESVSLCKTEFQRETDINQIVKFPIPPKTPMSYGDLTNPPNLEDMFSTIHEVQDHFMNLPSDVRRLINNDPSQLQNFLNDPKNRDLLVSRGLLIEEKAPEAPKKASPEPSKVSKDPKPTETE